MKNKSPEKSKNGQNDAVKPQKHIPGKPDKNPDPTRTRPGVNEPEKIDPTRIDEPEPEETETNYADGRPAKSKGKKK